MAHNYENQKSLTGILTETPQTFFYSKLTIPQAIRQNRQQMYQS